MTEPMFFTLSDQDAFNIAAMASPVPLSEMGPETMDFTSGGWTMSHALGAPKPWNKHYFYWFLLGNPPTLADNEYWRFANGIIKPFSSATLLYKKSILKITSFLGRFYSKYK